MEQAYSTWSIILLVYSALCMVESQFPPDIMFPPMMTESGENSPVLDVSPLTVTVTSGETAVLPCSVQNPGEAEVSWFTSTYTIITTGDTVVTNDKRININTSNPGEWYLMIKDVLPSDADEYLCMLQTFPPQTKHIDLIVLVPPSIDKGSLLERYLFQKGGSLIVLCQADGDPKPSVKWYAYKTESSSMEEVKVLVSSSSTLVFEKLKPSDGGIYRCEAESDIGKDMYEIFLQEVYAPRLTTAMRTVGVKEHATTVLQCEIESNPAAKIGWQRNGTLLRSNFKYQIAMFAESETKKIIELTIKNTEMSDSGDYLCLASNSYGRDNIRFYVIVETPTTTTQSTTTTTHTTTTTATRTSTEELSTRKTVKPPPLIITEELPGELADSTTLSEVHGQYPYSPKTGASHNTAFINTQSCTLILSSCAFLLLFVL